MILKIEVAVNASTISPRFVGTAKIDLITPLMRLVQPLLLQFQPLIQTSQRTTRMHSGLQKQLLITFERRSSITPVLLVMIVVQDCPLKADLHVWLQGKETVTNRPTPSSVCCEPKAYLVGMCSVFFRVNPIPSGKHTLGDTSNYQCPQNGAMKTRLS